MFSLVRSGTHLPAHPLFSPAIQQIAELTRKFEESEKDRNKLCRSLDGLREFKRACTQGPLEYKFAVTCSRCRHPFSATFSVSDNLLSWPYFVEMLASTFERGTEYCRLAYADSNSEVRTVGGSDDFEAFIRNGMSRTGVHNIEATFSREADIFAVQLPATTRFDRVLEPALVEVLAGVSSFTPLHTAALIRHSVLTVAAVRKTTEDQLRTYGLTPAYARVLKHRVM